MSTAVTRIGRSRWHHSGQTKTCQICGAEFRRLANTAATDWDKRRFCSMTCVNINRRRTRKPNEGTRPRLVIPEQPWAVDSACRTSAVEFVPDSKAQAWDAIALCVDCPVRAQCLAYGVTTRSYGVWGGQWLDPSKKTA